MQLPDFKLAVKLEDKVAMEKILWNLGIDTTKEYAIREVLHRPLTRNEPWFGSRIEAFERVDHEWIRGGHASLGAIAHSSSDKSLTRELLNLNPENNSVHEGDYACSVDIDLIGEVEEGL